MEESPFVTSYDDYMAYSERTKEMRDRLRSKKNSFQRNKLIEPIQEEKIEKKQQKVIEEMPK